MARAKTPLPPPGSIADTVAHLAVWGRRAPRGLARIVFDSEYSRQTAVRHLDHVLRDSATPFHQVELPLFRPAVEVVRLLVETFKDLEPGIVSISGFATAFSDEESLADSLRVLNFNRENLARFPLRQTWWMTPHFAETFIHAVPDLNSWFLVRLRLTESVPPPREIRTIFERSGRPSVNIDEARRRAGLLAERASRAIDAGQPADDILHELVVPAVQALFDAGAENEAAELRQQLARRLAQSGRGVGRSPSEKDGSERIEHAEDWAERITGQVRDAVHAREVYEQALGPEHPNTAASLNNLAYLYNSQGRRVEAEPLFRRALQIREKTLGPGHPDTALSLNNLAALYDSQGRYAEAEPLYRRALQIREKALGPEHPDTAASLNNLAYLYNSQGRQAEAEPLYRRALQIYAKALGPEHLNTALSLNNLAYLYNSQGRHAEAEPLYRGALQIFEKALGPEHPNTATSLGNLAALYDSQGQYAEAEPLFRRALQIREKALGPEHLDTATSLSNLAHLLSATDRPDEARVLRDRAGAILDAHRRRNPVKTGSDPEDVSGGSSSESPGDGTMARVDLIPPAATADP